VQTTGSIAVIPFGVPEYQPGLQSPVAFPRISSVECKKCTSRKDGFFCNLGSTALREFAAISTPVALRQGDILFMEGQPSKRVSIVCEGRLKLTRSSRHGKTLLVRVAGAGEALGLSAALANSSNEVTAQAMEPVQLRTIQRKAFLEFLRKHGEGSLRAAENIGREYRAIMNDAYRLGLTTSIAGRLAHLLLEFARDSETGEHAQPEIEVGLKHEELAFKLGSSRESVTRVLNDLKRTGVIAIKGSRMVLLDKDALAKLI
jgi:CRP/FNR family transcriptional regulator